MRSNDEKSGDLHALLDDAKARAARYLDELATRRVAPEHAAVDRLVALGGPLPDHGHPALETVRLLDEVGSPATVATAGGRYFGFVTGSSLPVTVGASWLATAWDQNAALEIMSPTASRLDEVALQWMGEAFGFGPGLGGAFVTGATMANLAGLLAGRTHLLNRVGWDVASQGLFEAPPVRVIVGGGVHVSISKALSMIGFGRDRVEVLLADDQGAIIGEDLPALDGRPTIVCLQAGNVNTGASDPFEPLIEWAHAGGAWVHVDGAFGLWAAAAPGLASQVRGVEGADSWATDCHKWLNVPYDCGAILVREPTRLRDVFSQPTSYLPAASGRGGADYSPEFSQRARGAAVWAALHHLGRDGLADLIDRCCEHARSAAAGLENLGLEVLNDVVLNQVLFRGSNDQVTSQLLEQVQAGGDTWMGPTQWQGRLAIRLSVSSWATTAADIETAVKAVADSRR